jgi:hypothetical protein
MNRLFVTSTAVAIAFLTQATITASAPAYAANPAPGHVFGTKPANGPKWG